MPLSVMHPFIITCLSVRLKLISGNVFTLIDHFSRSLNQEPTVNKSALKVHAHIVSPGKAINIIAFSGPILKRDCRLAISSEWLFPPRGMNFHDRRLSPFFGNKNRKQILDFTVFVLGQISFQFAPVRHVNFRELWNSLPAVLAQTSSVTERPRGQEFVNSSSGKESANLLKLIENVP